MARQRNPVIIRPSQRRQRSKWRREQSRQRAVIVAGIIAIVMILAIPAYGYWTNFVAPPRNVVLQVDDTKFTLGFMSKYLKGLQEFGGQVDLTTEPFRLLQVLEENELIRSGTRGRGITLDSTEIDQEVRDRIIGSSPEMADVPPDQLDREFKESYKRYLSTLNLSKDEYRGLVEADLLRDKLTDLLGQEVPTVARQSRVFMIEMVAQDGDPEQLSRIEDVGRRLQEGEDFSALAEEFSEDRASAVNGGELGWVPEGAYPRLDPVIASLEPGETSEVVTFVDVNYFVRVAEVEEARPVDPETLSRLRSISLQQWLFTERGNHRISTCFGGGSAGGTCDWQYDWVVKQVREAAQR